MSAALHKHLTKTFVSGKNFSLNRPKSGFIQVDDQDDYDNIADFVNIFVSVKKQNHFHIELTGKMVITQDMADLVEIYQGKVNPVANYVCLTLHPKQIEVLQDLAGLIRKTATIGDLVGNPHWHKYSARTISTLNRFVRCIQEYVTLRQKQLI
jgi:hypothetical protein